MVLFSTKRRIKPRGKETSATKSQENARRRKRERKANSGKGSAIPVGLLTEALPSTEGEDKR